MAVCINLIFELLLVSLPAVFVVVAVVVLLLTVVVAATAAPAFVVALLLDVVVADVAPALLPLCCFQIDDKAAPTAIPPIAVVKSKKLEVELEEEVIFISCSENDLEPKRAVWSKE
jgi:hypothetical protein